MAELQRIPSCLDCQSMNVRERVQDGDEVLYQCLTCGARYWVVVPSWSGHNSPCPSSARNCRPR